MITLIKTRTCPKCKTVESILKKKNIKYETLYAEEDADVIKSYGIKQCPSMIDEETGYVYSRGLGECLKVLKYSDKFKDDEKDCSCGYCSF